MSSACVAPFKFIPPTHEAKVSRRVASWLTYCYKAETIGVNARTPASCRQEADLECNVEGLPDKCYSAEMMFSCLDQVEKAAHMANPHSAMDAMPSGC